MGHILSIFLVRGDAAQAPASPRPLPRYPFVALLVSGGHTALYRVDAPREDAITELGATRDDAAGEAFDKVAKLLGLPYPGGRHVEVLAERGDPARSPFTRPMVRPGQRPGDADYYDMSFSGLKTAVRQAVEDGARTPAAAVGAADIARGFQDALIGALVEKTARAVEAFGRTRVVLGGGVASNRALAAAMTDRMAPLGVRVFAPPARLATDNAAMIARAGLFHFERGERAALDLNAYASQPIPGLVAA
jgi:N6-L-threonylcarbamoyladenine synthase